MTYVVENLTNNNHSHSGLSYADALEFQKQCERRGGSAIVRCSYAKDR
jgi:hypothetical protein